jgi:hypothetical protein
MKMELASTTAAAALLVLSQGAQAKTKVADIYGSYDAQCGINITDCSFGTGYTVNTFGDNFGEGDTPSLFIVNPTNFSMTGASITATSYQGLTSGLSQTETLPVIPSHTVLDVVWGQGFAVKGNLFTYDYDDSYGKTTTNATCAGSGVGTGYCAFVGNFDIKFAATLNGGPISSDFSPSNTQDTATRRARSSAGRASIRKGCRKQLTTITPARKRASSPISLPGRRARIRRSPRLGQ